MPGKYSVLSACCGIVYCIGHMATMNTVGVVIYYAALLPRRGPHIASHSVCPSVCLSVRPVLVYIRTVLRAHIQNS